MFTARYKLDIKWSSIPFVLKGLNLMSGTFTELYWNMPNLVKIGQLLWRPAYLSVHIPCAVSYIFSNLHCGDKLNENVYSSTFFPLSKADNLCKCLYAQSVRSGRPDTQHLWRSCVRKFRNLRISVLSGCPVVSLSEWCATFRTDLVSSLSMVKQSKKEICLSLNKRHYISPKRLEWLTHRHNITLWEI